MLIPFAAILLVLALVSFCIGINQDQRSQSASVFVFYITGVLLMACAVLLILQIVLME